MNDAEDRWHHFRTRRRPGTRSRGRRSPLLPLAVLFLAFAMGCMWLWLRSLRGEVYDARAGQRRALAAAASHPDPDELRAQAAAHWAAAAKRAGHPPDNLSSPAKKADPRTHRARREFIAGAVTGPPAAAANMEAAAERYRKARLAWALAAVMDGDRLSNEEQRAKESALALDKFCEANRKHLSTFAEKSFAAFEERGWQDWDLAPVEVSEHFPADANTPQSRALREFVQRRVKEVTPLLDECEYYSTVAARMGRASERERLWPEGTAEYEAAEAQLKDVREKIAAFTAAAMQERREWEAKEWEGWK